MRDRRGIRDVIAIGIGDEDDPRWRGRPDTAVTDLEADTLEPGGFVARAGRGFTLEGRPFRVAGANAAQVIANVDRSGMRSALSLARQMGANVVRFFGASEIGSLDRSVPTLGSDPAFRPWFQAWDPVTRRAVPNTGDNGLRHLDAAL